MIRSDLCDYSDTCIHIRVVNIETTATPNNRNKKVIFKSCAPFSNCISEIINLQVDGAHDVDGVI